MIMAILAVYYAILLGLEKLRIITWNRYWIASFPALWLVMQLIVILPMGWDEPQGPAIVLRNTVQIISSNVPGEIVDVPARQNVPLKAGDVLFRIDPIPYEAAVKSIEAQLKFQEQRLAQVTQLLERDSGRAVDVQERQATVDNLRGQLAGAKWNLEKTTVRAPTDGYITNVSLHKGDRAASAPVMAFVEASYTGVAVEITQNNFRNVRPGQIAELAFKFSPGKIHHGKVQQVVQAISTAQLLPSGLVATPKSLASAPFIAVIDLGDRDFARQLPMGATADAAIYTREGMSPSTVVRKILIRQISILNYVNPF